MQILRDVLLLGAAVLVSGCAEQALTSADPEPLRAVAAAGPQLTLNEVMADPSAVGDDVGEWFEVHNWGAVAVDLQGWRIASGNDALHTVSTSVSVPAGGYVVLGRNGTRSKNGGVTVAYAYGTAVTLANTSDWLALRDAAGTTVDSVAWSSAPPAGASRGVKDPSGNNTDLASANWTTQTSAYGKGDKGTPGAQNNGYVAPITTVTVSPASATVAPGGTQQFTASATNAAGSPVSTTYTWTSADPSIATVSAGGLASAVAAGTTTLRATAPNGVYGEATLTVSTGSGGGVVINELMPNPSAVTDDLGEWFEVYNWGSSGVNLQGWTLASNNDVSHTIAASVVVPAGGYVVLARNGDSGANGGVNAAYVYGTALTLANSADWLALRDPSGATVDSVAWSSVPTGASRGVKDASLDNTDMGGSNWITQTSVYGGGDKGTPVARNDGYVSPLPAGPPATVTVSPSSATIEVGSAQQFSATAVDANGKVVSTTYTWSSSSSSIATVNASGLVTGVAAGSATVRATASNGVYGEAAVTVVTPPPPGSASELVVRVLDIGQGDATYLSNGTSRVIIDGGPDSLRMGTLLDSLGLNNATIDVVILSHQHYDHHAGLRELFRASRNITVRYFFENRDAYTNTALEQLRDSVDARAARGQLVLRDTDDPCGNGSALCTITLNGGAKLHVMRPNPDGTTPNNRSTPVKLVGPDSASFSMWFAGDAEHEAQDWFVNGANYDAHPGMRVNVVKGNHHGSCNGVRSSFVQATDPDWVTFSLAANNDYGHVHNQTKEMYSAFGKPWYRTDQNGTITIRSPGTAGGGYTISVTRGASSSSGPVDRASSQVACNPLP
ncbi:MAG TPA: lamin tail domain-containing protein [Longimicrobiaceae bacterium]|nr:lamin tail domain-containing protein [Longimicrobiaceae bacterium]